MSTRSTGDTEMTETVSTERLERFDHIYRFEDGFGSSEMVKRENGGYVKFSDYAALRAATPPPPERKEDARAWEAYWPGAGSENSLTRITMHRHEMEAWKADGAEISPLYASPVPLPVTDGLRHAFRHVEKDDWEHLFAVLPDTHRGKFWKAVMIDARVALSKPGEQFECPINQPGCTKDCGSYGCGN